MRVLKGCCNLMFAILWGLSGKIEIIALIKFIVQKNVLDLMPQRMFSRPVEVLQGHICHSQSRRDDQLLEERLGRSKPQARAKVSEPMWHFVRSYQ